MKVIIKYTGSKSTCYRESNHIRILIEKWLNVYCRGQPPLWRCCRMFRQNKSTSRYEPAGLRNRQRLSLHCVQKDSKTSNATDSRSTTVIVSMLCFGEVASQHRLAKHSWHLQRVSLWARGAGDGTVHSRVARSPQTVTNPQDTTEIYTL